MANTKVKAEQLEAAQTNITSVGTLSALTVSGDLTVDTSTLKVDSSNNRVGIGLTNPSSNLHIRDESSNTDTYNNVLRIESQSTGTTVAGFGGAIYFLGERNGDGALQGMGRIISLAEVNSGTTMSSGMAFHTATAGTPSEKLRITHDGKLGVGTTSPDTFLHIKGSKTFAATEEHLKLENTASGEPVVLSMMALADNGGTGNEGAIYFDAGANGTVGNNLLQLSANHQNSTTPQVTIKGDGSVLIGADSGDAFNDDSMLRLQRTGDRVFVQIKTDDDQDSGILFGTASDDVHHQLIHDVSEDALVFKAQSADTIFLDSGSHVGIKTSKREDGTTAMAFPLTINGANDGGNIIEAFRTANSKFQLYMSTAGTVYADVTGTTPLLKIRTSGTDRVNIHESNGYVGLIGSSDVRLTLSSEGTEGDNSANWVRGNSAGLSFNAKTSGKFFWEIGGTEHMRLEEGVLRLKDTSTTPGAGSASESSFIYHDNQSATALCLGSNYESSSAEIRFQNNTDVLARIKGNTSGDVEVNIGEHSYNSNRGLYLYGSTGRIFIDTNYDSFGAEIILINNQDSGGSAAVLQYRTDGTAEGTLRGDSGGLVISNNSDYRKKKDIRDLTGSLNIIKSLQPRLYKYREGFGKPTHDFVGFIAHEIQEKMPNIVDVEKDAVYTQEDINAGASQVKVGDPKYQTVSYTHNEMITRLVGAIQEQQTQIEALQAEVKALKGG